MAVPTFTVRCTRKTQIIPGVYELCFEKPEGFTFKPGQFVLFDVPHPDNKDDIQARAYSIASTPDDTELLFLLKISPGGRMSRWVEEKCEAGTTITMKGPFGVFTLTDDPAVDILFICTGAGIAPFRSQILSALQAGDTRRMDLIFGVQSEHNLFWVETFAELAERHPNFFLHVTLSEPSASWSGARGRVQALAADMFTDFSQKSLYVCGNPDMTKEVKALALGEWGMTKDKVHAEGYI